MAGLHQSILDGFRQLRTSWPHRGWSYDDRFECVASSFSADFGPQARALLDPLFPHAITARNLASSSPALQEIATRTGGLRAAQMLFGADPAHGLMPYGLWWPWEEAQTISLRVGVEGASNAQLEQLRACFGIVS